jgi:hypothetical protein
VEVRGGERERHVRAGLDDTEGGDDENSDAEEGEGVEA